MKNEQLSKSICFLSIFDLTVLQYEQAIRLEERGHECFWITTNPRWTQWLYSKGVSKGKILELIFESSKPLSKQENAKIINEIIDAETSSSFTINMAMIADRFLNGFKKDKLNNYACLYFSRIKDFLIRNRIDIVFGEPTNFNELITSIVCAQIRIPFVYPQDLRIPTNRFFFELGFSTGIMISSGHGVADYTGKDYIDKFKTKQTHPKYFHLLNSKKINISKYFKVIINRSREILNYNNKSLTHHRFIDRISNKILSFINSNYINYIFAHDDFNSVNGKIAFFGLHVQPEASIDVAGPYFSDQLKLIKDMRRALPFDITLVVKEHPNFLGLKSINFFRELKKIPNVCVVRPSTSTFDIYKRTSLVLTVSGTIAYEAALLGIPAITFSKQFFKDFPCIYYCPDIVELKSLVNGVLNAPLVDEKMIAKNMDRIIQNSYKGYWTDPFTDEQVMSISNIEALFVGFLDVVEGSSLMQKMEGKS